MLKKVCPNCRQTSYSSCAEGIWVCPICSHDLTRQSALPLNSIQGRMASIDLIRMENSSRKVRHLTLVHSR